MMGRIYFIALMFVWVSFAGSINCFADDPCEDAKTTVYKLIQSLNAHAKGGEIPVNGTYKVTPHKTLKNGEDEIDWYQICYMINGQIKTSGIIQNLDNRLGYLHIDLKNGNKNITIVYAYGAGGKLRCSYSLIVEDGRFYASDYQDESIQLQCFGPEDKTSYSFHNKNIVVNLKDAERSYALLSSHLSKQQYLFKIEGTEHAFIKVNGRIITLYAKHDAGTTNEEYTGQGYTASLIITSSANSVDIGKLEISLGSAKNTFPVHGYQNSGD